MIQNTSIDHPDQADRRANNNIQTAVKQYDGLLHRSKFILGPHFVEHFPSWIKFAIDDKLYLTVHPDLKVHSARLRDKAVILLGFILDPDNPQATDADIVNTLAGDVAAGSDFFTKTLRFGGRWILIVSDGKKVVLLNDCGGLRRVFYTDNRSTRDLWCASEPSLIAELLGLKVDSSAYAFITSGVQGGEYWWPGDSTPYKEIRHLIPNHALDLETGRVHRFWPNQQLPLLPLDTTIQRSSLLLRGLIASAAYRFQLVLGLTAGVDSRLVLAASREIRDQISCMTLKKVSQSDNHPDITVASNLAKRFDLKHEIVRSEKSVNNQFHDIFIGHSLLAHEVWASDAQAIFERYGLRKVTISGSMSETARCFYKRLPWYIGGKTTGEYLACSAGMGRHPFAVAHFNKWLAGVPSRYKIHVLDLFYWEQRIGSWLAMCQGEFDMACQDTFTPFNCRLLLMNMLSVKEKYRRPPNYILHKHLISKLWPEVLKEPINPHKIGKQRKPFQRQMRRHLAIVKSLFFPRCTE